MVQFLIRTGLLGLFVGMGAAKFHDQVLSKNGWSLESKTPILKNVIAFVDQLGKGRNHRRSKRIKHHQPATKKTR